MVNEVSTYVQVPSSPQVTKVPVAISPVSSDPASKPLERSQADNKLAQDALTRDVTSQDSTSSPSDSRADLVDVDQVIKEMKDYVQNVKRDLEFTVDDESGRTIITVKDPETDEIIRQIPPEELLYVVKALQENRANLFVETKA